MRVAVVGNCQARMIAHALATFGEGVEITSVAIVHLLQSAQVEEYRAAFEEADVIVAQLVADNYHCDFVRTKVLIERYGDKVLSVVNLFYEGYTPDWHYIRDVDRRPLGGAMGDYQNATILSAWTAGESVERAAALMGDLDYNRERYGAAIERSLDELRRREADAHVPICDVIESLRFERRLFFIVNHPAACLFRELASRLLARMGVEERGRDTVMAEGLDQIVPLANPVMRTGETPGSEIARHKGVDVLSIEPGDVVTGPTRWYTPRELVEVSYRVFDAHAEAVRAHADARAKMAA